ncbi:hypothetical protein BELL_0387g00140 [Botrytis elliptica]|uniref:Aminotransferase class I/classII large domain-containing protein n=1 Tax=Botrytis elliptica TaxID=278938 RepID=A0A4Z1JNI6_9HELO|nr:hypothetical protein EAE99_003759 [Botrytis elliptica]TGO73140.1 hypothetical protein BELL_0387g00140 [Botrytis elliptica]
MLPSQRCQTRNQTLIPHLLDRHMRNDPFLIDLGTTENYLIRDRILNCEKSEQGIRGCDLSYDQGIGGNLEARKAIAGLINTTGVFNPRSSVQDSQIVLAPGASGALSALIEQLCDPGDAVMISTPYWSGLDLAISVHKDAVVLPVHIPLEKLFTVESIEFYEQAMDESLVPVKAMLICNPHNPLGCCYPKEVLQALLAMCDRRGLHYISDEVYGLSVHNNHALLQKKKDFISALSIDYNESSVHVLYSLSKDFGCSGIRLGAIISQNNVAVRLGAALTVHGQVSSAASLFATRSILRPENVDFVVVHNGAILEKAYLRVKNFLLANGIAFIPATAGMFVFAQLCPNADAQTENEFQKRLKVVGLSLSAGTSYHYTEPGWFRICYAVEGSVLSEGLQRLNECLSSRKD